MLRRPRVPGKTADRCARREHDRTFARMRFTLPMLLCAALPVATLPVSPRPLAAQPTTPATPAAPATPRPAGNCTPPYTVDANGIRHMKPECLH